MESEKRDGKAGVFPQSDAAPFIAAHAPTPLALKSQGWPPVALRRGLCSEEGGLLISPWGRAC